MNDENEVIVHSSSPSLPSTTDSGLSELVATADAKLLQRAAEIRKQFKQEETPQKDIYERLGPIDKQTGEQITLYYVRREYMADKLTEKLPGWSWMIVNSTTVQFPPNGVITTKAAYDVVVHGRLVCFVTAEDGGRMPVIIDAMGGHRVERTDFGGIMEAGDAFKAAADDAFKKACEQWGIARDIYRVKEIKREKKIERRREALEAAMKELSESQIIDASQKSQELFERMADLAADDNELYSATTQEVKSLLIQVKLLLGQETAEEPDE